MIEKPYVLTTILFEVVLECLQMLSLLIPELIQNLSTFYPSGEVRRILSQKSFQILRQNADITACGKCKGMTYAFHLKQGWDVVTLQYTLIID